MIIVYHIICHKMIQYSMSYHVVSHATTTYHTLNPPINIVDFRGLDSSIILILRGGIPRPIGISQGFSQKV